jgi:hypothetical protein
MITVTPLSSIPLSHRALHIASATRSGDIVATDRSGKGTLIEAGSGTLTPLQLPVAEGVAIHPDGTFLALATDGALLLLDSRTGAVRSSAMGKFDGCHFNPGGDLLWASRRPSEDEAVLEIRALENWEIVARVAMDDPFGQSAFVLCPGADPWSVSVWAAAGQDGQLIYWASHQDGTISVAPFDRLRFTTPPSFSSGGGSFIVIAGYGELHHYSHPGGHRHAAMPWPFEDEDDQMDGAAFAGDRHALLQSREGHLYLVELAQAVVVEQVVIAGHEPRPVSEIYPSQKSEQHLCTDLSYFSSLGAGMFLSVHHRGAPSIFDWTSEILTWRLDPSDVLPDQEQRSFAL